MENRLLSFNNSLTQKFAINEIIKCNEFTVNFYLILTEMQALQLIETRASSLKENGRIEFGGGVISKLIKEFCDSPYISMHNYTETLHELLQIFYYYKNDTLDLISDDELIKLMHTAFDGVCQGSLELLSDRELAKEAKRLRFGHALVALDDDIIPEEDGEYEEY